MAEPPPDAPGQHAGEKRKRADDENEDALPESDKSLIPDQSVLVPENYQESEDEHMLSEVEEEEEDHDLGDESEEVKRHDESLEAFPNCAIYDGKIEGIKTALSSIPRWIADMLSNHECNSKQLKAYGNQAAGLVSQEQPKRLRAAMLGAAGAGKSSLLNCLTDNPNLAKSLSGGESCTCVPTEYSATFPGQTHDFAANIEYFTLQEIRDLLRDIIKDYSIFAFECDEEWDADDIMTANRAHDNALEILFALFTDMQEFATRETARLLLKLHHQGSISDAVQTLAENCEKKLENTVTQRGYVAYRAASSLQLLRRKVDPLITSGSSEKPALWPLVKQVCIGICGSRVLDHLTIVDLPGISDTNQTRVDLTLEYIKSCDHVFVVAPISRVVDDATVYKLLLRYGRLFRGNQSRTDTSQYGTFNEERKAKAQEIKEMSKTVTAGKSRKRETKAQMADLRQNQELLKDLKQQLVAIEEQRFEWLVQSRNSMVTAKIQTKMGKFVPEGQQLEIHCVSNLHYMALQGVKGLKPGGIQLSPAATGVPTLRSYALTLPAAGMLTALERHSQHKVQAFLKTLLVWLKSPTIDRRQDLLDLAAKPQAELPSRIDARHTEALEDGVADATQTAVGQLSKKRKKHASTIKAFIRRFGNHSTAVCPKESWNENFSKRFSDLLQKQEQILGDVTQGLNETLDTGISQDLQDFIKGLDDFTQALPREDLINAIRLRISSIHDRLFETKEYSKQIRNILVDATTDGAQNAFSQSLAPVYEVCMEDAGAGVIKRSMDRLEAHLTIRGVNSPFAANKRKVSAQLLAVDRRYITHHVESSVSSILGAFYSTVDDLADPTVIAEADMAAKDELAEHVPKLDEECAALNKELEKLKELYKD